MTETEEKYFLAIQGLGKHIHDNLNDTLTIDQWNEQINSYMALCFDNYVDFRLPPRMYGGF